MGKLSCSDGRSPSRPSELGKDAAIGGNIALLHLVVALDVRDGEAVGEVVNAHKVSLEEGSEVRQRDRVDVPLHGNVEAGHKEKEKVALRPLLGDLALGSD